MNTQEQPELIYFYNNYYIGNRNKNEYFLIDTQKYKAKMISELQYNIITLLSEIKQELKNI